MAAKPQFALAYSNLASLYHSMGKVELAQRAGEQAITIDPNFAEAHNNLGSIYLDQVRGGGLNLCCYIVVLCCVLFCCVVFCWVRLVLCSVVLCYVVLCRVVC